MKNEAVKIYQSNNINLLMQFDTKHDKDYTLWIYQSTYKLTYLNKLHLHSQHRTQKKQHTEVQPSAIRFPAS